MPEAWYPPAQRRPLGEQTEPALNNPSIICLHTMVMALWDCDRYFRAAGYGGTESHFGIGYDGEVLQWQDLGHQADANLDGNHRVISIETADRGTGFPYWDPNDGSAVPAWLPAQIEAIAQLVAWLCDQFGIPCAPISDSRPERTGIGYHRQGIDNWRVAGGEKWSSSTGKVCPGDRRVAQIPEVIARAKQILAGDEPDQPEPPPEEEDDMPKPFLVNYGGGVHSVAADLSSRTGIKASADVTALLRAGQHIVLALSANTMATIPAAGATSADLSNEDIAQIGDEFAEVFGEEGEG